jgi:low molecular weight protein-tyrosine phosphatase
MRWENDKPVSVLFVCLGNICRSPMAEGAFRAAASKAGLEVSIDSVGTASYHIGDSPDPRAISIASQHGVDISNLRGRQLTQDDFARFTYIVALDTANMAGIKSCAPRGSTAQLSLLLDVHEETSGASVADPYYGDESDFAACWAQIVEATEKLAEQLKASNP